MGENLPLANCLLSEAASSAFCCDDDDDDDEEAAADEEDDMFIFIYFAFPCFLFLLVFVYFSFMLQNWLWSPELYWKYYCGSYGWNGDLTCFFVS